VEYGPTVDDGEEAASPAGRPFVGADRSSGFPSRRVASDATASSEFLMGSSMATVPLDVATGSSFSAGLASAGSWPLVGRAFRLGFCFDASSWGLDTAGADARGVIKPSLVVDSSTGAGAVESVVWSETGGGFGVVAVSKVLLGGYISWVGNGRVESAK
jgi:hypothetical protein